MPNPYLALITPLTGGSSGEPAWPDNALPPGFGGVPPHPGNVLPGYGHPDHGLPQPPVDPGYGNSPIVIPPNAIAPGVPEAVIVLRPPVDPGYGHGGGPVDPGFGGGTPPHPWRPGHGGGPLPDHDLPSHGHPGHALPLPPVRPGQPIVYPPGIWPQPPTPGLPPLLPDPPVIWPPAAREGLPEGSVLLVPITGEREIARPKDVPVGSTAWLAWYGPGTAPQVVFVPAHDGPK